MLQNIHDAVIDELPVPLKQVNLRGGIAIWRYTGSLSPSKTDGIRSRYLRHEHPQASSGKNCDNVKLVLGAVMQALVMPSKKMSQY